MLGDILNLGTKLKLVKIKGFAKKQRSWVEPRGKEPRPSVLNLFLMH